MLRTRTTPLNTVDLSASAIKRFFSKDERHHSDNENSSFSPAKAFTRQHAKLDKWRFGSNLWQQDQKRYESYTDTINDFISAVDLKQLANNNSTLEIDLKNNDRLVIKNTEKKLVITLERRWRFGPFSITTNTRLYEERCEPLENTKFYQQCKIAQQNIFHTGRAASWMGELVKESGEAFDTRKRERTEALENPDSDALLHTISLTNHGSGCKEEEAEKYGMVLFDLHHRATCNKQYKLQNDGPDILDAANFDENVIKSTQFLLESTLTEIERLQDNQSSKQTINLNLSGYSRGASITVVAYNFLQYYLKGEYKKIPPEILKNLDTCLLAHINKSASQNKIKDQGDLQYRIANISFKTDLLLLDPVRGHYSGKYGKYATCVTSPSGNNSVTYCDVVVSTKENYGGTVDSVLDLSHVKIELDHSKVSNKVYAQVHAVELDHSDINRDQQCTPLSPQKTHFANVPNTSAKPLAREIYNPPEHIIPKSTLRGSVTTKRNMLILFETSTLTTEKTAKSRARALINMDDSEIITALSKISLAEQKLLLRELYVLEKNKVPPLKKFFLTLDEITKISPNEAYIEYKSILTLDPHNTLNIKDVLDHLCNDQTHGNTGKMLRIMDLINTLPRTEDNEKEIANLLLNITNQESSALVLQCIDSGIAARTIIHIFNYPNNRDKKILDLLGKIAETNPKRAYDIFTNIFQTPEERRYFLNKVYSRSTVIIHILRFYDSRLPSTAAIPESIAPKTSPQAKAMSPKSSPLFSRLRSYFKSEVPETTIPEPANVITYNPKDAIIVLSQSPNLAALVLSTIAPKEAAEILKGLETPQISQILANMDYTQVEKVINCLYPLPTGLADSATIIVEISKRNLNLSTNIITAMKDPLDILANMQPAEAAAIIVNIDNASPFFKKDFTILPEKLTRNNSKNLITILNAVAAINPYKAYKFCKALSNYNLTNIMNIINRLSPNHTIQKIAILKIYEEFISKPKEEAARNQDLINLILAMNNTDIAAVLVELDFKTAGKILKELHDHNSNTSQSSSTNANEVTPPQASENPRQNVANILAEIAKKDPNKAYQIFKVAIAENERKPFFNTAKNIQDAKTITTLTETQETQSAKTQNSFNPLDLLEFYHNYDEYKKAYTIGPGNTPLRKDSWHNCCTLISRLDRKSAAELLASIDSSDAGKMLKQVQKTLTKQQLTTSPLTVYTQDPWKRSTSKIMKRIAEIDPNKAYQIFKVAIAENERQQFFNTPRNIQDAKTITMPPETSGTQSVDTQNNFNSLDVLEFYYSYDEYKKAYAAWPGNISQQKQFWHNCCHHITKLSPQTAAVVLEIIKFEEAAAIITSIYKFEQTEVKPETKPVLPQVTPAVNSSQTTSNGIVNTGSSTTTAAGSQAPVDPIATAAKILTYMSPQIVEKILIVLRKKLQLTDEQLANFSEQITQVSPNLSAPHDVIPRTPRRNLTKEFDDAKN